MKDLLSLNDQKRGKMWLWYFIAACVSLLIVLVPFMIRGNHLIWAEEARDGATQGVTYLNYLREVGWLKAIGNYDYFIGLGADAMTSLSFFSLFDPFIIFIYILPFDIVWVYDIIMALKFVAAGAAFLGYMQWRGVRGGYAVSLALLYMYSGFILFTFVRHLNLTSGPIWLPLIVMGAEMVYRKKNPFVLTASAFLCLINSFYMFFFNSVFIVLYCFLYHYEACRQEGTAYWRTLVPRCWKIAALYAAGVLLAGFMLLPNAYAYLNAARSAGKGLAAISAEFLALAFGSVFFPIPGLHYSIIGWNFFVLAQVVLAFLSCKGKGYAMKICTAVLFIGFFTLVFGYAMNIFNYANNRWSYLLSFSSLALTGINAEERGDAPYPEKHLRVFAKTAAVLACAALVFALIYATEVLAGSSLPRWATVLLSVLCGLAALALIAATALLFTKYSPLVPRTDRSGTECPPVTAGRFAAKVMAPAAVWRGAVIYTVVFALVLYSFYSAEFVGGRVYRELTTPEEQYVSRLNEEEFFRTDSAAADNWWDSFTNSGVNNRYMGTRLYNSMTSDELYSFTTENALYNPAQNLGICGLDNRPALQSLLSVKYYCGEGGSYGFTKAEDEEGVGELYENENYVPFGFAYTKAVSREYYEGLDPVLRQYAMLDAMVTEDGGDGTAELAPLEELTTEVSGYEGEEGLALGRGHTVTITARGCAGKEVYLRLYGASVTDDYTEIRISGAGKTRTYRYAPRGDLMYSDMRSPCISFGVQSADVIEIELSLTDGNRIDFEGFAVQGYAAAAYESAVDRLQAAPHLEDVTFGENRISGNIALEEESYIFFSLPYSSGWSAAVDGAEAEIVRANSSFMAVRAGAGTHKIELTYTTPWLKAGSILSAATLGVLACLSAAWIVLRVRRGSRKADGENN